MTTAANHVAANHVAAHSLPVSNLAADQILAATTMAAGTNNVACSRAGHVGAESSILSVPPILRHHFTPAIESGVAIKR